MSWWMLLMKLRIRNTVVLTMLWTNLDLHDQDPGVQDLCSAHVPDGIEVADSKRLQWPTVVCASRKGTLLVAHRIALGDAIEAMYGM
jgi:hypothetical protein